MYLARALIGEKAAVIHVAAALAATSGHHVNRKPSLGLQAYLTCSDAALSRPLAMCTV